MKPKPSAEILSQLPIGMPMNQPQLATNIPINRGLGRAALRRKVPHKYPLLKLKESSQSLQIQRPILPS